jgi:hypothetical protein
MVEHAVTRFKIRMRCFDAKYLGGTFASPFYLDAHWVELDEIDRYPISVPQRRIVKQLGD